MLARLILVLLALPAAAVCAPAPPSEAAPAAEPTPEPRLAPKLLTPTQLLTGLFDVLPARTEATKTALLPIGFSERGAFAYISHSWHSEMGGLVWDFVIQDLVNDKVLIRLPPERDSDGSTLEEGVASHRVAIETALKAHGINARSRLHAVPANADPTRMIWHPKTDPDFPPGTPLLRPFPLFVGATACAVTSQTQPDSNFELVIHCGDRAKPLGKVWTPTAAPVAIGALISPWEARVAVVVQIASWALHGSDPMELDFKIFGAHLTEGFPAPTYTSP